MQRYWAPALDRQHCPHAALEGQLGSSHEHGGTWDQSVHLEWGEVSKVPGQIAHEWSTFNAEMEACLDSCHFTVTEKPKAVFTLREWEALR